MALTQAPAAAAEILLLEDRTEQINLVREAVDSHRLNVVQKCPDVLEYLMRRERYSAAMRPDLILLSLDLSNTEDCEMLTEIKKDPNFKRIPVVVLAASERYEDVFQAYDLHANAYICKPADPHQFVKVLRATLNFWLGLARLPKS